MKISSSVASGGARLRAERRLGRDDGRAAPNSRDGEGRPSKHRVATKPDSPPSLAEAGIDKNLASRARAAGRMDGEQPIQRLASAVLDRGKSRLGAAAEDGVSNTVVGRVASVEAAGDEIAGLGDQLDRDAADLLWRTHSRAIASAPSAPPCTRSSGGRGPRTPAGVDRSSRTGCIRRRRARTHKSCPFAFAD